MSDIGIFEGYGEFDDDDTFVADKFEAYIGVAAFTVGMSNRECGGPEEGGWWYDTFDPVRVFYVRKKYAQRLKERLERVCAHRNKEERRREPGSVLCHGYWTVQYGAITDPQPVQRPRYS